MSQFEKYKKVKEEYVDTKNQNKDLELYDNIHFWGHQMMEHSLFLYLGLVDANLKQKAKELQKKWEDFMNKNFVSKNVDNHKIFLDKNDLNKIDNININEVKDLLDKTKKYKSDVLNRLNSGEWLGWSFPSFVKHILKEANYFEQKLNNKKLSQREEVKFWNSINGEHMGVTSHLIDPALENDKEFDTADNFYHKFMELNKHGEEASFVAMSINFTKELDKFAKKTQNLIKSKKFKSLIHPVLIEHQIREGERSASILNTIKNEINKAA